MSTYYGTYVTPVTSAIDTAVTALVAARPANDGGSPNTAPASTQKAHVFDESIAALAAAKAVIANNTHLNALNHINTP